MGSIRESNKKANRDVAERLMTVMHALVNYKYIPTIRQFCEDSGFQEAAFSRMKAKPDVNVPLWVVAYVTEHYPVSAEWLLNGRGTWRKEDITTRFDPKKVTKRRLDLAKGLPKD